VVGLERGMDALGGLLVKNKKTARSQ